MTSSNQLDQIKEYLEDDLNCEHKELYTKIISVQEIFKEEGLTIYQVSRQIISKRTGTLEPGTETLSDLLVWRLDSWEDLGQSHICGNTSIGVRDLSVRTMLMWEDAIPPGSILPPWSDIPQKIDEALPMGQLIDEAIGYLSLNNFEVHALALQQIQRILVMGDMSINYLEELDSPEE